MSLNLRNAFILSGALTCFSASLRAADQGLLVQYMFDGNGTNAAGSALHLTSAVDISYGAGIFGQAAVFSGSQSGLYTSDAIPISGNMPRSVSTWIYLRSVPTASVKRIVSFGRYNSALGLGQAFGIYMGGSLGIGLNCNWLDAWTEPNVIELNRWQHIAVVYSGALETTAFYVDGCRVHTDPAGSDGPIDTVSTPIEVGLLTSLFPHSWNGSWDGSIDDIRIYDRALTEGEVAFMYGTSQPTMPGTLSIHPSVELRIVARQGKNYQLQSSRDLTIWFDDELITGNDTLIRLFRVTSPSRQFFRAVEVSQ